MWSYFALSLVTAVLLMCQGKSEAATKVFSSSTTTVEAAIWNPEKGFYHYTETLASSPTPLTTSLLNSYRTENISVIFRYFVLDTFLTSKISTAFLTSIKNDMSITRSGGFKMVMRFCYTLVENRYPSDAVLSQVLKHIDQVAPVIKENYDVILVLQAGFIGTWGEWYYSKNYAKDDGQGNFKATTTQWGYRSQIVDKLLAALPVQRMLQIRYVGAIQRYVSKTTSMGSSSAFTGTKESRLGLHNDCFLTPYMDMGTFDSTAHQTWLAQQAKYVMVGGETCAVTTGRTDCTNAMAEISKYHWTYLNTDYHKTVISKWKSGGCYEKIKSMLGYRYQIINATYPTSISLNGVIAVTITVKNTGSAPLYNQHDVRLALRNKSTGNINYFPKLSYDIRTLLPGNMATWSFSNSLVSGIVPGSYELLVDINDVSIPTNSNYRVLFVNVDTRHSTRMNLIETVTVK